MMREIKFRAIHKLTKHWFEESNIVFEDGKWFEDGRAHEDYRPMNLEQVAVMQYTGLKDKNGTEIYEGDALGKQGYWGYYVGQKDGAYVAIPLDKVQRINWSWKNIKTCVDVGFVVIGNIYENPELLLEGE